MKLSRIYPSLPDKKLKNINFKGVSCDSRYVARGDIFFIIKSPGFDIFSVLKTIEPKVNAFIGAFEDKGKILARVDKKPVILVKDPKEYLLEAVNNIYSLKDKNIEFIGVTGTNGKTTTSALIYHILKKAGFKASLVGTVHSIVGRRKIDTGYTTPDFLLLRRMLASLETKEKNYVVLEVSSHGISQGRIKGIRFSRCVFTNLSRDHLDYHKTMSRYFQAKKGFFLNNRKALSIINIDDSYGRKIFRLLKNKISYGLGAGVSLGAREIKMSKNSLSFKVQGIKHTAAVESRLCGFHNVYNILAALGTVTSLGLPLGNAARRVKSFKGVEGRLQELKGNIFVDYAHTPQALEKSILALKDMGYKRVITVFGCGGDRDKGKRKPMGKVSCRLSYFTYITSDNPRSENPGKICRQIEKGFYRPNYLIVLDRKEAIRKSIKHLSREKQNKSFRGQYCVLIAGKGHESYQLTGRKKIPFKDSAVVKSIVK